MWLQNLLLLGTVVCSFSAPNRPPTPVTPTQQQYEAAIKEALSILRQSNDTAAVLVSEGICLGYTWAILPISTDCSRQLVNMTVFLFCRMNR